MQPVTPLCLPASSRRLARLGIAALCAGALLLAGCSGSSSDPSGSSAPGSASSSGKSSGGKDKSPRPELNALSEVVTVTDGTGPVEESLAASTALYASSPVVVLAAADDPVGVTAGVAQAKRLGVPLLLNPGVPAPAPVPSPSGETAPSPDSDAAPSPQPSTSAAPSPAAAPSSAPPAAPSLSAAVRAEIERLAPKAVLATGTASTWLPTALDKPTVVTDPGELPKTQPAEPAQGLTVMVGPDSLGALATAQASGAEVLTVAGSDPRSDADTVIALAKAKPTQVLAVGAAFGSAEKLSARIDTAATGTQLPGGGQLFFPGRRLVALYGHPGTGALGVLGEQDLAASVTRAQTLARAYQPLSDVPVLPTFEIIATVAHGDAGEDGNYSGESSVDKLKPWVNAIGAAGGYAVLDLQPGLANLLDQAKLYEPLLRLPNVGLGLDPEWKLQPGQKPLKQIGSVDAAEINSVLDWLAEVTADAKLPQKLVVLHQFRLDMIGNEANLDTSHDNLALLIHMDGNGAESLKDSTWETVVGAAPAGVWMGWKNFYDEDPVTLSPERTMTKKPTPVMISYQ